MKAIIFGATGLVGSYLTDSISYHPQFEEITLAVRKPLLDLPSHVQQVVVDFEHLSASLQGVDADVVFCCLGTTIAKAKTKENFQKVDYEYPKAIAKHFADKAAKRIVVISSIGANAASSNFYLRTKGEMEIAVQTAGISDVAIVRPGLLLGHRKEFRLGERIASFFMRNFEWMLIGSLRNYRAIHGRTVAEAMLALAVTANGVKIIESEVLKTIAKKL